MDDQKNNKTNLIVELADIEPFSIQIPQNEESFYKHIIESLNRLWHSFHYGVNASSSEVAFAKAALYFAEMYYRKSALLRSQGKMLDGFEEQLDRMLRDMEM